MVDVPQSIWIPALAAFLAVAFATIALVLVWEWLRDRQRKRTVVQQLRSLIDEEARGPAHAVLRSAVNGPQWLRPVIDRVPRLKDIEFMLQQAGMTWSMQTFLLLSAGSALAVGLGVLIFFGSLFMALVAAGFAALGPYAVVRRRRTNRLAAFEEKLPESIDLIGRALRAGHPLSAGFRMAADDGEEPVAGELRRVFEEQRFGLPLQESLLGLVDRIPLVDVRILVTAILIQREVGGNLAEILDNLSSVIRARFTIRRQIRVYTAQGRMTGYLLAVLPIILACLLYWLNPEYMSILRTDPAGKVVVGFAATMQLLGFLWIRKIVDVEI